ncbi:hypothetical protein JTB14_027623 [Gonioctena quinquepunctata]|nr:hypothetical protein JTB14_027623 [Gonioctena quinquepunctata]
MPDLSLTYKQHLTKTAQKIKSRNNILCKLAGTTWGADASTLRSTALAMTYSVAEYCAPVWYRSSHTHKIDVQLNESMRIITWHRKTHPYCVASNSGQYLLHHNFGERQLPIKNGRNLATP